MPKRDKNSEAKILILDIEWQPALAYVWGMWKQNITPDKLVDHGGMLCFSAHWYGTKEFLFYSKWNDGQEGMAQAALDLITEADAVVHYNGDKYDMPKITGEIMLAGLAPPPKVASIDLLKTVKQQGFNMNRLAYIAPLLEIGGKLGHEGFDLWKKVMAGDEVAQRKMEKYCVQDVRLTTKLYERILPFIRNHPFLRSTNSGTECPNCGSHNTHKRGTRTTRTFAIQRNQCKNCSSWFETTRRKIKQYVG